MYKRQATTTTTTTEEAPVHPILGPCLLDLGAKRIHLVSAQTLSTISVWKKQRVYRHFRAKSMATDKLKTLSLGLPGVIGIYEVRHGVFVDAGYWNRNVA